MGAMRPPYTMVYYRISYKVIFLEFDDERLLVFFPVLLAFHVKQLLTILLGLVGNENRSLREREMSELQKGIGGERRERATVTPVHPRFTLNVPFFNRRMKTFSD